MPKQRVGSPMEAAAFRGRNEFNGLVRVVTAHICNKTSIHWWRHYQIGAGWYHCPTLAPKAYIQSWLIQDKEYYLEKLRCFALCLAFLTIRSSSFLFLQHLASNWHMKKHCLVRILFLYHLYELSSHKTLGERFSDKILMCFHHSMGLVSLPRQIAEPLLA